ncbi:hypothetical protein NHX12_017609 [Muraenolepis orangiensis]|uniref:Uncharacterized protein n=1 Tax=Muraenolepis orangiensis TaxID=630683 RepID=A0A9Q0EUX8_9TELE|nr:hypothetical protein NHX12_017609 [Muraenolepis orangiensis]
MGGEEGSEGVRRRSMWRKERWSVEEVEVRRGEEMFRSIITIEGGSKLQFPISSSLLSDATQRLYTSSKTSKDLPSRRLTHAEPQKRTSRRCFAAEQNREQSVEQQGGPPDVGKMLGGEEKEEDPDADKKEEERQEALRQQEEERKDKYGKMEAERETMRQGIRDKRFRVFFVVGSFLVLTHHLRAATLEYTNIRSILMKFVLKKL